jgi:SHS2 domain-containing protein
VSERQPAGHEVFDHTAEVGIRAWGRDLAEAYAEAAGALFDLMVDRNAIEEREARRVTATAADREELLVNWLNELTFLVETEGLVFRRFVVERLTEREIVASAFGERLDRERHQPAVGVKSATYHQLEVRDGPPALVRVVFDV